MIRRILLGYDASESAVDAFAFATELARKFGAELHIVAVASEPIFGDNIEIENELEEARRYYGQLLEGLRSQLSGESFSIHCQSVVGHPAEKLIHYAETHEIDHIVVGHRGHSILTRWLIGSVAHRVLVYAHCAVTVVRR